MHEATIRRLPLDGGDPHAALWYVFRDDLERHYLRGSHIVRQGEVCGTLFIVLAGIVRESAVSPEGRDAVLGLWGAGQVFGRLPPLVATPSATGARALTECRALALSPADLRRVLAERPGAAPALAAAVADRARTLARSLERALWYDAHTRIREQLRDLAGRFGAPDDVGRRRIELPLVQEDLAAMVGASRETANRAVARLIADGRLRLERRRYVVADPREEPDAPA